LPSRPTCLSTDKLLICARARAGKFLSHRCRIVSALSADETGQRNRASAKTLSRRRRPPPVACGQSGFARIPE
jgi:hypothetical protein